MTLEVFAGLGLTAWACLNIACAVWLAKPPRVEG